MNAKGDKVAIGAYKSNSNGTDSGEVKVYEFNSSTQSWDPIGQVIQGVSRGDNFGYSVSLNAEGSIMAIGAIYNRGVNGFKSGHVRVYELNSSTETWDPIDEVIEGEGESHGERGELCPNWARIFEG